MIKEEVRSLFLNLLPKYDKVNKYHPRVIDAAIERVLIDMYQELFNIDPLALQRFTKGYGYDVALSISNETATGLFYRTLPAKIIPFRDRASGVRRVSTIAQGGLTFFPIDQREMDLVRSGSDVDVVTSKIGYAVTPTRVEFYNISGTVINAGVRMDLIVPFSEYADTDTVLIPDIKDTNPTKQVETFQNMVLQILGIIPPVDLKDDNAEREETNNKAQ